jgi:hypothetical protein
MAGLIGVLDTVVKRFGVGEGVLRRERSRGLTTSAGEGNDLTCVSSGSVAGGEGVRFLITRLPLCGEGGPRISD